MIFSHFLLNHFYILTYFIKAKKCEQNVEKYEMKIAISRRKKLTAKAPQELNMMNFVP